MKKIDRYVLHGFLVRFIASHLVVFGLYVSFDALKRMDQIQRGAVPETLSKFAIYYAYQFPISLLDTVPPLLLLGAGLMLVEMARSGELLILKASGVSLRRAVLPIFVCAVPVAALVAWTRENVVPWAFRQQEQLDLELSRKVGGPYLLKDPRRGLKLYVANYDYANRTMSRVTVMEFYPDGITRSITEGESGGWLQDGGIYLQAVSIQEFDSKGSPVGKPTVLPTKQVETGLTPYDFVQARRDVMTTRLPAFKLAELRRNISENPDNARLRVMLQSRMAAPLVPFVLLLVGIPLLVGYERSMGSRVLGAVVCIMLTAGFHVLSLVCVSMGNSGTISAEAAAWLPPVLAGAAGLWLFGSMHT